MITTEIYSWKLLNITYHTYIPSMQDYIGFIAFSYLSKKKEGMKDNAIWEL